MLKDILCEVVQATMCGHIYFIRITGEDDLARVYEYYL